ncbi:hypothetical protein CERSUDRAFT_72604 [Gelatoporia subvermispora B]|uniref:Uncharacterized protein n=1 Tax=Ceriporiopsis subvermispora (strain B) TaxID=914234 RepID=M2R0E7_CERS8|nr:hypothetical protein CERSUDRAFT_72604 [Gelatoporia subvermispora B]
MAASLPTPPSLSEHLILLSPLISIAAVTAVTTVPYTAMPSPTQESRHMPAGASAYNTVPTRTMNITKRTTTYAWATKERVAPACGTLHTALPARSAQPEQKGTGKRSQLGANSLGTRKHVLHRRSMRRRNTVPLSRQAIHLGSISRALYFCCNNLEGHLLHGCSGSKHLYPISIGAAYHLHKRRLNWARGRVRSLEAHHIRHDATQSSRDVASMHSAGAKTWPGRGVLWTENGWDETERIGYNRGPEIEKNPVRAATSIQGRAQHTPLPNHVGNFNSRLIYWRAMCGGQLDQWVGLSLRTSQKGATRVVPVACPHLSLPDDPVNPLLVLKAVCPAALLEHVIG